MATAIECSCLMTSTKPTKSVTGPHLGFLGALIVPDADVDV